MKYTEVFIWSAWYFCQVLAKPELSRQIIPHIKFTKIRPVGAELYADGQTDGHDAGKSPFSQFFGSA
jgi:hypothetical protein